MHVFRRGVPFAFDARRLPSFGVPAPPPSVRRRMRMKRYYVDMVLKRYGFEKILIDLRLYLRWYHTAVVDMRETPSLPDTAVVLSMTAS